MQVLVTGGLGFIGSHIAEYHLKRQDRVVVIDNLSTGRMANLSGYWQNRLLQIHQADLLTWPYLEECLATTQRIYHCAAIVGMFAVTRDPSRLHETNVLATERLLRLTSQMPHKPKLMIASSSSVYGHAQAGPLHEDVGLTCLPPNKLLGGYAISKIEDEALAMAYFFKSQINVTIIRLFNTIGPRQVGTYGMVIPRFIEQACQHQPITIFGDGKQTRSFCDVRDTVVGLDRLLNNPKSQGQIVNLGNNDEITINHLAEKIKELAHSRSPITYTSYQDAYGQDWQDITQRRPELDKLRSLTGGFTPKWTLDATITDLIYQYKKQHPI
jgi:UDP-glucose 4-epimerase